MARAGMNPPSIAGLLKRVRDFPILMGIPESDAA